MALNRGAVVTASNDGPPLKNTENVDRPMSAMLYSPLRYWPFNPADRRRRLFSAEIRQAKAFTPASFLIQVSGQLDQPNGAM